MWAELPETIRWTQRLTDYELEPVERWFVFGPARISSFGPVLTGDGVAVWTWAEWVETGMSYDTGRLVHWGNPTIESRPPGRAGDPRYIQYPRGWLPSPPGLRISGLGMMRLHEPERTGVWCLRMGGPSRSSVFRRMPH